MRVVLAVTVALGVASAPTTRAQESALPTRFEWPKPDPNVIPDVRVRDVVVSSLEEAREAAGEAAEGKALAAKTRRLVGVRGALGINPEKTRVDDGVTVEATPCGETDKDLCGTINYRGGASLIGLVSANIGVYTPEPEAAYSKFSGQMYFSRPMTGVIEYKNKETFTGSLFAISNASGIYLAADGAQRFVGKMDFRSIPVRPLEGQLEDAKGRLLAVVR